MQVFVLSLHSFCLILINLEVVVQMANPFANEVASWEQTEGAILIGAPQFREQA